MANAEAALAIIGASYLQLPLVRKARELGIRTVCFAWEEGAVCRDFADISRRRRAERADCGEDGRL